MRLRFGECVLDTERHELTRAGRLVALSPKAFRLLQVLAERRPRIVGKSELRPLVWPDTIVGGTTLARLVNELRAAISEEARSARFIRTVPRVGYGFVGPVIDEEAPLATRTCSLQWGTRQIPLRAGENVIGRGGEASITIGAARVSRRHARILLDDGCATIEDLGSKNGTYVAERRVQVPTELRHGDTIGIGTALLVFRVTQAEETTSTDWARQ